MHASMSIIMLLLLGYPASDTGSPVAIACELHSRIEINDGQYNPSVRERNFTQVIVIDDKAKTIKGFDPVTVSMKDFCASCQLNFGKASINYKTVETIPRQGADPNLISYLFVYEFNLDRMSGKYSFSSRTDRLSRNGLSSKLHHDVDGLCRQTAMPSLVAPGAKF